MSQATRQAILAAFAGLALCASIAPASAAARTYIGEITGLDCVSNQAATLVESTAPGARTVGKLPEDTPVKVLGGKVIGKPVAFPNTDDEWNRTWIRVRFNGKTGWVNAGKVNCGG
jgi:hypothetical protein